MEKGFAGEIVTVHKHQPYSAEPTVFDIVPSLTQAITRDLILRLCNTVVLKVGSDDTLGAKYISI